MKDDNKERDLDKNPIISKLSALDKKIILGVFLILILAFIGYSALKGKFPSAGDMFTTYGPLPYDSVYVADDFNSSSSMNDGLDSLNTGGVSDSISNGNEKTKAVGQMDSLLSNSNLDSITTADNKDIENIFHVNTHYDKIEVESSNENVGSAGNEEIDLFSELLLPNSKDQEAIERVFLYKTMSYKSMLKLLAIAGQKILLNEDKDTGEMMLEAIVASDNIAEIFIINRKGIVVYSSLKKMKDVGDFSPIVNYNIESNTIKVNQGNERNSISVPIFYTHGKIGHVIMNIKL